MVTAEKVPEDEKVGDRLAGTDKSLEGKKSDRNQEEQRGSENAGGGTRMVTAEKVPEDEKVGDRFAGTDKSLEGKKRVWRDEEGEGSHYDTDQSEGVVAKKKISEGPQENYCLSGSREKIFCQEGVKEAEDRGKECQPSEGAEQRSGEQDHQSATEVDGG